MKVETKKSHDPNEYLKRRVESVDLHLSNLLFHWSPLICTSIVFQGYGHCIKQARAAFEPGLGLENMAE